MILFRVLICARHSPRSISQSPPAERIRRIRINSAIMPGQVLLLFFFLVSSSSLHLSSYNGRRNYPCSPSTSALFHKIIARISGQFFLLSALVHLNHGFCSDSEMRVQLVTGPGARTLFGRTPRQQCAQEQSFICISDPSDLKTRVGAFILFY
jgi:hypothetical protein